MKQIRPYSLAFILLGLAFPAHAAYKVEFEGPSKKVIEIPAEKNTGLNYIYVSYDSAEINAITISGITGTEIEVSRYSNLGGGYAEEIPSILSQGHLKIENPGGNLGYIVRDGMDSFCFWLVDYKTFPFDPQQIVMSDEQECENTRLNILGSGEDIIFYTVDGRQMVLGRDVRLDYSTLEWNEEQELFEMVSIEKKLNSISDPVILIPPFYCNTIVALSGDRFLKEWKQTKSIESQSFPPNAVTVNSKAEQTNLPDSEEPSNILKDESDGLGGSAPADITFYGYVSDGVLHTEWQMASDEDFEYILFRFNEQDVSYTFTEEGRYYMRFIGSNSDGSCETIGDTYSITIGSSDLRIPNAFSPNNDGVNDVWKVGYRSLLEFKCWIFDSKGNQLFTFDDPAQGWDGKYRGKSVNPGVYYYVIQALGADGKKYKRSGDINILNYKKYGESTGGAVEEQ
ncbi:MAG: gliding motility-associated C-terminal domain-containing protein [Muribaculaceae bacterium]|nr:gliding motility-associated C-terminal domain-containing protein [Muribaculaceae bacterium]